MINSKYKKEKEMHLKVENLLVILLLLPFGLRGVITTPVIDNLIIIGALAFLPVLLLFINEKGKPMKIGKLAVENQILSKEEVSQILFCQENRDEKFGEIAVMRNFLTSADLTSLLALQKM